MYSENTNVYNCSPESVRHSGVRSGIVDYDKNILCVNMLSNAKFSKLADLTVFLFVRCYKKMQRVN